MPSRRRFIAAVSGAALVAGCGSSPTADRPPTPSDPSFDPTRHVAGADEEWSSFGCNASNTREVHDGRAPVDGLSERWRVAIPSLQQRAPVVAGGRVFVPGPQGLGVIDADDGSPLWRAPAVEHPPLVRDGTAYVADGDADALRALDAASGDERWAVPVDGEPAPPSMYPGRPLVFGVGETVHAVDPETRETVWTRDVFGEVLGHAPVFMGHSVVAATAAGEVSLLRLDDGNGVRRWRLPASPVAPPSADTDSVYVSCRNGTTYALGDDSAPRGGVLWTADTGWAERGIAVAAGQVVVADGSTLTAVDAESGETRFTHGMGDWRHTAPCYGRDTLFVGGDRLWALDPTPSGGNGPAVRFERSFDGRVGPGPVVDDGRLYVVAETAPDTHHLLAFDGA